MFGALAVQAVRAMFLAAHSISWRTSSMAAVKTFACSVSAPTCCVSDSTSLVRHPSTPTRLAVASSVLVGSGLFFRAIGGAWCTSALWRSIFLSRSPGKQPVPKHQTIVYAIPCRAGSLQRHLRPADRLPRPRSDGTCRPESILSPASVLAGRCATGRAHDRRVPVPDGRVVGHGDAAMFSYSVS